MKFINCSVSDWLLNMIVSGNDQSVKCIKFRPCKTSDIELNSRYVSFKLRVVWSKMNTYFILHYWTFEWMTAFCSPNICLSMPVCLCHCIWATLYILRQKKVPKTDKIGCMSVRDPFFGFREKHFSIF